MKGTDILAKGWDEPAYRAELRAIAGLLPRAGHFLLDQELVRLLARAGFGHFVFRQTIFSMPDRVTDEERAEEGYGRGSFVAIRARASKTGN